MKLTNIKEISQEEFNKQELNSIKTKYKKLRDKSKAPSFALQYGGTIYTLMKKCGFSEIEAKKVEGNYHSTYQVSDNWVKDKVAQAVTDGYTTLAFGLKLRTPLLERSIMNLNSTLQQAKQEARSMGNAISGQSYGLLNNRALVALMNKVWESEYKYDILPVALIHDALYFVVRNDVNCIAWLNKHLIEEMKWQDLSEISHPELHLNADLDIFHPSWDKAHTLKQNAKPSEIYEQFHK